MTPPISHFLETSFSVADLARSCRFYQRIFEQNLLLEDDRMVAQGLPGPAVLLLFRHSGPMQPSQVPGGTIPGHDAHGRQHLCLAIPVAALQAWKRHLLPHDIVIESRVIQSGGGSSFYFREPDGHPQEIATLDLWPIS